MQLGLRREYPRRRPYVPWLSLLGIFLSTFTMILSKSACIFDAIRSSSMKSARKVSILTPSPLRSQARTHVSKYCDTTVKLLRATVPIAFEMVTEERACTELYRQSPCGLHARESRNAISVDVVCLLCCRLSCFRRVRQLRRVCRRI